MADILASKLYVTSPRKAKILAAIQDPVNQELVQQMRNYLDEEFISPEYLTKQDSNTETNQDVLEDSDRQKSSSHTSSSHSFRGGGSFSGGGIPGEHYMEDDDIEGEDMDNPDDSAGVSDGDNDEPAENEPIEDEPIQESVSITSSVCVDIPIESIKGTFNSRDDCKGVTRIVVKDAELWIYYNDDTNLNNVMTADVDLIAELGYSYLEFNRLARSNNAIVFDIIQSSDVPQGDE